MIKTYSGSCHCGAVRYEADLDFSKGTTRCNCSICTKARAWFLFAKGNGFRLIQGADALTDYQWSPAGRSPGLHYLFCRACGIRICAQGDHESMGGPFHAVAVASLDDVDPDVLAAAPIKFVDGRHDRYDRAPEDIRSM